MPISHRSAAFADLGRCHVALGKKIAAQAIRDLGGIDAVVLLLCRRDRPQRSSHEEARSEFKKLTTAEEARLFVQSTGIDILAPAVGNAHGMVESMVQMKNRVSGLLIGNWSKPQ